MATASGIGPNAGLQSRPLGLKIILQSFKTSKLSLPCVAGHHGQQLVPVPCLKAATSPWTGTEPYRTLVKFPDLVKFWRQSQKFFLSNLELCHPDRLALLIWCGPCEFGGLETQILPLVATASDIAPNAGPALQAPRAENNFSELQDLHTEPAMCCRAPWAPVGASPMPESSHKPLDRYRTLPHPREIPRLSQILEAESKIFLVKSGALPS